MLTGALEPVSELPPIPSSVRGTVKRRGNGRMHSGVRARARKDECYELCYG